MNYQTADWTSRDRSGRGGVKDGPSILPKDQFSFDLKEALDFTPSSSPSSGSGSLLSTPAMSSFLESAPRPSVSTQQPSQYSPAGNVSRVTSHRAFNMAPSTISKAQTQCLQLSSVVAAACDQIAEKMSEYPTLVKHLPHGFGTLANDVLDTCQVLFFIEAGLGQASRHHQSLPLDMITVLEKKFRAAQIDFRVLDHAVSKQLEYERKGTMGRMKRGFGKMFGENSIERMTLMLAKTRDDLKIGAVMFQWKLGAERMESELGIGYIGLAAALEGTEFRRQQPAPSASEDKSSHRPQRESANRRSAEDDHFVLSSEQSQLPVLPPLPRSERLYGTGLDSASAESSGSSAGTDYHHLAPSTKYTRSSNGSYHDGHVVSRKRSNIIDRKGHYDEATDSRRVLDDIVADTKTLELDSAKVFRLESESYNMPRAKPRSSIDADRPNVARILVSAIHAGDHKLVMQLLDRGVSPDAGAEVHALNEALQSQDAESVRFLLHYGANPNSLDKDGVSPLVAAAEKSDLDGAIALIKYGADPSMPNGSDVDSPLFIAAVAHNIRLTHLLLAYGGDPNQINVSGNTILTSCIGKKTPKVLVDMLLNYGAQPNEKNREGKHALFQAVTSSRVDIVESLIEHGANINLPGPKHVLWPATFETPCLKVLLANNADFKKCPGIMELAASTNNIESIRLMLEAGVDPNAKKDGTYTPLCSSIRDNRKEIFDLLLRSGANPNIPASEYPCFKSITHHREHFLPALVAAGGNLESPKGIMETAVTSKNDTALRWLLEQGLDPNEKTPKGYTPLTSAIRENNTGFVEVLLSQGANPNIRGQDWPVCMAVRNPEILARVLSVLPEPRAFKGVMEMAVAANQLESVKLLLGAGVSVEDRNGGVFSPLTSAIREHRKDIVMFLINEGKADVNAPGEHLPIVKALRRCATEHTDIIDMLLEKGADPNKMYRGWNGIMQALENGDVDMLQKIATKSGVNLDVKDELGRTVTEVAVQRRWEEAVEILLANAL